MRAIAGISRRSCRALQVLFCLVVLTDGCAAQTQQLREAVRTRAGEAPQVVSLPDLTEHRPDDPAIAMATFRLRADLGPGSTSTAIYVPGVFGSPRVVVNGHVVTDRIDSPLTAQHGGADRLVLAPVPREFLRSGSNEVEVTLASRRWIGMSPVWVGDEALLRSMHGKKLLWQVTGPVVAAGVIMALSLCVLVLWARRPDQTLYGYFGLGGMLWSLHTIWQIVPERGLAPPHIGIWFNLGYGFFIAPLVVFCLRLAQWHLPRFERAMWIGIVTGPFLLYAAYWAGTVVVAEQIWRLLWIAAVGVGVFAVGIYASKRRDTQGVLLLAIGVIAMAFGVRDWLADQSTADINPTFLTSFSGLLFFPLVAWILIDGFVRAARDLERLNVELGQRVADKSAQLRHAFDEMRLAKDAAESANRAKSTFLAAASHDLRQPTHALGLYMAAWRGERRAVQQAELAERMSDSIAALNTMFNALLDVSRIDAGAVRVEPRPFALAPMLHRLAHEFSRPAADRGLRLSVRIAANPERLNASSDPVLVERIVRNLLGNAVKHTSAGGVLLACRLRHGAADAHWRVEVWDTGPGIPAAARERVFDEFVQLGPERDRTGGMGLGLSIVRRLAQLLGHRVRLDSTEGRGSRFMLELPATAESPSGDAEMRWAGALDGLGVGVVEDDAEVREAMRVLLEGWGCVVTVGSDANELLVRAGDHPAERLQVLVVDYELREGRTGLQAIESVRRACGTAPPALIVSGASAPDRLLELQASGFEWVIKPVAPARLRSWLVQAMRASSAERSAERAPPDESRLGSQVEDGLPETAS